MSYYSYCIFFFSSRRRHTRFKCDWSSDVCSSDLARFVRIEAVQREECPDPLGVRDRPSVAEDVEDRRPDADPPGAREDAMGKLQDVGVQADLAGEVRDDRARIHLLHLGREIALRHPGRAEAD